MLNIRTVLLITVYTDHAALKSILSVKTPKGRLARWIMDLQDYQPYEVVHKKGVLNVDADALSRIADVNAQDFSIQDITLEMFQDLQKVDPTVKFIKSQGVQKPYVWHQGLVCFQEAYKLLPFVPVGLIEQVLFHVHSKSTGGHFGVDKTLCKVKEIGWWSRVKEDVEWWVKSC